jgi:hypothetical protein
MPSADELVDLFDTHDIVGNESEEPDTSDSDSDNDEDFDISPLWHQVAIHGAESQNVVKRWL